MILRSCHFHILAYRTAPIYRTVSLSPCFSLQYLWEKQHSPISDTPYLLGDETQEPPQCSFLCHFFCSTAAITGGFHFSHRLWLTQLSIPWVWSLGLTRPGIKPSLILSLLLCSWNSWSFLWCQPIFISVDYFMDHLTIWRWVPPHPVTHIASEAVTIEDGGVIIIGSAFGGRRASAGGFVVVLDGGGGGGAKDEIG